MSPLAAGLSYAVGTAVVVAVFADVFRTVLLPSARGSVAVTISTALWWCVRRLPRRLAALLMPATGPAAVVLSLATWLTGLLTAFALVYLPHVRELSYSTPVGSPGFAEALYLSGTSLTTLGFGDVVAVTPLLRLVTVLEAASGLGVLTAVLGYLPAMYTLVSALRTANQAVADLDADSPDGAAELLAVDAAVVLDEVRRDVLAARQHLQRFPVLHYFRPPYDESVVALARGATTLWVAGHFAQDEGRPLHKHVEALERALARLVDDLERHGGVRAHPEDAERARAVFGAAHRAAGQAGDDVPEASVRLLARVQAVLDAYAVRHGYPVAG